MKAIVYENVAPICFLATSAWINKWLRTTNVNHYTREYARGQAHVNTAEGYFSLLKRGIVGVYHHVSKQHLHRYLAGFDFRYTARKESDAVRAALAVKAVEGKRLQYK